MAVRERIYLTLKELKDREISILNDRHIERYGMIRQWCSGDVVDFGCGCGYGSYMIAQNPDVISVHGVDSDPAAIGYANLHYSILVMNNAPVFSVILPDRADTLVALEVMEHIRDEMAIPAIAVRLSATNIIVSYPSKKTTHYNKHHFHDFTKEDIYRIWEESNYGFKVVEFIELYREHMIVRIERV